MKARTRGIGAGPTMEMAQTNLMAYALKYGTFDSTKWPEDVQGKFKHNYYVHLQLKKDLTMWLRKLLMHIQLYLERFMYYRTKII